MVAGDVGEVLPHRELVVGAVVGCVGDGPGSPQTGDVDVGVAEKTGAQSLDAQLLVDRNLLFRVLQNLGVPVEADPEVVDRVGTEGVGVTQHGILSRGFPDGREIGK